MKKLITALRCALALILFISAVLALASDSLIIAPTFPSDLPQDDPITQNPGSTPDDGSDKIPEEPIIPDDTIPDWSITPTVIKNAITDSKGNILCETRYSYPTVRANDSSDVSAFSRELEKIASSVRNFVDKKSDLYKSGTSDDFSVPPQITGYYTVNRFSSEIFSISFVFSEIAPDGTITETRMNYNLDLLLSASKISVDSVMNDAVSSVKNILSEHNESGKISLHSNYEKLLSGAIEQSWTVSPSGITFFFPKGSLSPTSYGDIEIFIDNARLLPLLSEYGKILFNISSKS